MQENITSSQAICVERATMLSLHSSSHRYRFQKFHLNYSNIVMAQARKNAAKKKSSSPRKSAPVSTFPEISPVDIAATRADLEKVFRRMSGIGSPNDPREKALELVAQADAAPTKEKAATLYNKALLLDPNCVDAKIGLVARSSRSADELIAAMERIIQETHDAWGPAFLEENAGHFWLLVETRPYMRVRGQLVDFYMAFGRFEKVIPHCEEILRLNPGDNMGMREQLLGAYLGANKLNEAARLVRRFVDEVAESEAQAHPAENALREARIDRDVFSWGATFAWGWVLLRFVTQGPTAAARLLVPATKANPFLPEMLLDMRAIPEHTPTMYTEGSVEEAAIACSYLFGAWHKNPSAIAWLRSAFKRTHGAGTKH